jgi:O-antigen/teichoic acid export membrane protein
MSLAKRTITSTAWNLAANSVRLVAAVIRSILLARWLPVNVFGTYGFAAAVVNLSAVAVSFGMGAAFLHRAPETEDEEQAAAVHFTLKVVFAALWAALLVVYAFVFTDGATRTALLVLTATTGGVQLAETGRLILARRVVHRRLALLDLVSVVTGTLLALALAWKGVGLWALLAIDLVVSVLSLGALYLWRPAWRPRFSWSSHIVRYYVSFGRHVFFSVALNSALDHTDDLWTGTYLGKSALAFYSRAWTFARYPRNIIADPMAAVTAGTFSELKGNRLRLSQAFFRTSALLVRSGFLLAGLLYLLAPEFVRLAIGEKWLPMIPAFRLMLVYSLLVPLQKAVSQVFASAGRPEALVRVRIVQLGILLLGLSALGSRFGITGVALAVNVMFVFGMAVLLWWIRAYVDFSLWRLFAVPSLALGLGLLVAGGAARMPAILGSDWQTGLVKLVLFSVVFGSIILVLEHNQLRQALAFAASQWRSGSVHDAGALGAES